MSHKPDTFQNKPMIPRQPRSPVIEAALHLAKMAKWYADEKATAADVHEAYQIWKSSHKEQP